jgi:predicted DNA-binding ribbon-helix-helix protein
LVGRICSSGCCGRINATQTRPRSRPLSSLVKRSFSLAGHRTSVALEPEFWVALQRLAQSRGQTVSALVAAVDAGRTPDHPLASALRVTALLAASEQTSG